MFIVVDVFCQDPRISDQRKTRDWWRSCLFSSVFPEISSLLLGVRLMVGWGWWRVMAGVLWAWSRPGRPKCSCQTSWSSNVISLRSVTVAARIIRLLNEPQPRGTPVATATWAMICRAINLAGEISADLSSPTNEAVKPLLLLHVSLWMNPADGSRMLSTPGPERCSHPTPPGVWSVSQGRRAKHTSRPRPYLDSLVP